MMRTEIKDTDPTPFSIFWVVPNQSYTIQIDFDTSDAAIDYEEFVEDIDLGAGETFNLNDGVEI